MKPVILVADSGSSKTDWRITGEDDMPVAFTTQGLNPYFVHEKDMVKVIEAQAHEFLSRAYEVQEVHFFGAGCSSPDKREVVSNALSVFFDKAFINVESDQLGSALATCKGEAGISCVLGTGSNITFFDGEEVHDGNFGLGYVLGDEGSGVNLGKCLVTDFLYGRMPHSIHELFAHTYRLTREIVIKNVYQRPAANTYLASFAPFVSQIRMCQYAQQLLAQNFRGFIESNIQSYAEYRKYPVHFVGSIAYHFADELKEACAGYNVRVGRILKKPIDELYVYIYTKITTDADQIS
ncbi:MAG: N-acetylglucosamine kinase [Mucilaginibacter polytrichastri]|nr:N-acetylglucosamine kinase [Mucilaginibacter polytrichastri]